MFDAILSGMRRNLFGAALAAALVLTLTPPARAASAPATVDLTQQFVSAGVHVSYLKAVEVGGIVVLRGDTDDAANAALAAATAQTLGYTRVANLIRVVDAPDDAKIERVAERQLATRVLDGCTFHVDSEKGVLTVDGRVQYELQKDLAMNILRSIDGVREVRASLQR